MKQLLAFVILILSGCFVSEHPQVTMHHWKLQAVDTLQNIYGNYGYVYKWKDITINVVFYDYEDHPLNYMIGANIPAPVKR